MLNATFLIKYGKSTSLCDVMKDCVSGDWYSSQCQMSRNPLGCCVYGSAV